MFAPIPSGGASAVNRGVKRPCNPLNVAGEDGEIGIDGKWATELLLALSKEVIHLSEEKCHRARLENISICVKPDHAFNQGMECSAAAYSSSGEEARKRLGNDYKGHPMGKKPDAYARSLLFRLVSAAKFPDTIEEDVEGAWQTLAAASAKIVQGDTTIKAKCCFQVVDKETEETKWIVNFASVSIAEALRVLQRTKVLAAQGIRIEDDRAPQSKSTRLIYQFTSKGKGKGKGKLGGA